MKERPEEESLKKSYMSKQFTGQFSKFSTTMLFIPHFYDSFEKSGINFKYNVDYSSLKNTNLIEYSFAILFFSRVDLMISPKYFIS